MIRYFSVLLGLAAFMLSAPCCRADTQSALRPAPAMHQAQTLPLSELSIQTAGKSPLHFMVQLAQTPEQQEVGLMWRKQLPPKEGMLFVFDQPKQATFWMENTLISLDLIFISADGTIANIARNAKPKSRDLIPSKGRVIAVLEIAGGRAKALGILPGQRVCHAALVPCLNS